MTTASNTTEAQDAQQKTNRCVSAVFETQEQVNDAVNRLLERGVDRENISIVGRNFHSETKISGFVTKKDVILDGLKSGAIFGSLFGSVLSLLTGVGVLFIPFIGSVVAAGPLGAALLGATTGAIAGSAGAGLVSALVALGMPEDKAAIYQTRLQAGETLLVVEVPAEKIGEIQLLLERIGGDEILSCDMKIPRQPEHPLDSTEELSPELRSHLSPEAQETFRKAYNEALTQKEDANQASLIAWRSVEENYEKDENGVWSKAPIPAGVS
ncbi:ChaB family protein [Phormidium sp. CCY1219]|uniref:ChaB family protein n=1 Tax=Phormidium sp. CCY1219 TaxID=2886104 RepID=UPI002D1E53FD|nr:ChaB family protein [Phormidium sp. CCY1219]MEB3830342.1 ChaB family protein [Phormidium sp. CCY1219]